MRRKSGSTGPKVTNGTSVALPSKTALSPSDTLAFSCPNTSAGAQSVQLSRAIVGKPGIKHTSGKVHGTSCQEQHGYLNGQLPQMSGTQIGGGQAGFLTHCRHDTGQGTTPHHSSPNRVLALSSASTASPRIT